ncbi:MAG: amidohydrolase [Flavobacteriaceae bacterium]|nr:amidohydrolase [Flavobacteriaceae bacterium]
MKKLIYIPLWVLWTQYAFSQNNDDLKFLVMTDVENQKEDLIEVSDKIWKAAEVAFRETVSAATLIEYAKKNGFTVEEGVAQTPTAFVATYGSGRPVIGILGEFDALPGLSQKQVPYKSPLVEGGSGHGCGHNIFGTASLGAAVALKNLIEQNKLQGTIKFFGAPAEEIYFGKLWMARAGLFDDLDVCLDWHPSYTTKADVQSSLALVDFTVEFYGQAAHAASDPWNGRSASDAVELYAHGINALREHVKPTVRIHYHIQDAGSVVNVVPDYSKIWVRVRDSKRTGMKVVYQRVQEMVEGAAILANVDYKVSLISGIHELLPNVVGGKVMHENLKTLGEITYTEEEIAFAHDIQRATDIPLTGMDGTLEPWEYPREDPGGGSTDVGDVSFIVPVIRMTATIAPYGTPWHSWAVVASGASSIGHKGLVHASKALAMTGVDLFTNESLRKEIIAEFKERKGDYVYEGLVPDGPPPLDYQD